MARMPQIPEPEINSRPGRLPEPELPNSSEITQPFKDAAQVASSYGDYLEKAKDERDAATAKLQHIADQTTVENMSGDYREGLRNLASGLLKQNWNTPEKIPEDFRKQSLELTQNAVGSAGDRLGTLVAQKYAKVNSEELASVHGLMLGRIAQKAKSDTIQIGQKAVRTAQAAATEGGLAVAISSFKKDAGPLLQKVHGEAGDQLQETTVKKMAAGFVEANGPINPEGTKASIERGLNGKGPLAVLPPEQLARYQKQVIGWTKGLGEQKRSQIAAEASDFNTKALGLFSDGQLDSKNLFQMIDSLQAKQVSIKHDASLQSIPDERVRQSEIVQTSLDTLNALKDASQNGGHFGGKYDVKKTAKLMGSFEALGKAQGRGPADILKVLEVQRDLAHAQAEHWVSPANADTITRGLRLLTGKELSKQGGMVSGPGPLASPIVPQHPRVMGADALDGFIKSGAFGKLTPEQELAARADYHSQVNDAHENQRNVDEKSTRQMAFMAVRHAIASSRKSE